MPRINIKDKNQNYIHAVTKNSKYIAFKEGVLSIFNEYDSEDEDTDIDFDKAIIQEALLNSLNYIHQEICKQQEREYFNIVRILTIIDDLTNGFRDVAPRMSRVFANEAFRLLLTHYDLKLKDWYTTVDLATMHHYAAYPCSNGKRERIQRNTICDIANDMLVSVDLYYGSYPENYEYLYYGIYDDLKNLLYPDISLHDNKYLNQQDRFEQRQMQLFSENDNEEPKVKKHKRCIIL